MSDTEIIEKPARVLLTAEQRKERRVLANRKYYGNTNGKKNNQRSLFLRDVAKHGRVPRPDTLEKHCGTNVAGFVDAWHEYCSKNVPSQKACLKTRVLVWNLLPSGAENNIEDIVDGSAI